MMFEFIDWRDKITAQELLDLDMKEVKLLENMRKTQIREGLLYSKQLKFSI